MTRLTITFWLCLLAFSAVDAGAVTLEPSATANVSDFTSGGFYPGGFPGGSSGPGYLTVDWGTSATANIGLVQFDLSAYAGDDLAGGSATLNLYQQAGNANGGEFRLYRNTQDWQTTTSDWATIPTTDSANAGVLDIGDSSTGWRTVDIGTLVQGWLNGTYPNYGLTLMRIDQTNPVAVFTSRDFSNPLLGVGYAPTLTFEVAAVPLPAALPLMLAGLGALGVGLRRRRTD